MQPPLASSLPSVIRYRQSINIPPPDLLMRLPPAESIENSFSPFGDLKRPMRDLASSPCSMYHITGREGRKGDGLGRREGGGSERGREGGSEGGREGAREGASERGRGGARARFNQYRLSSRHSAPGGALHPHIVTLCTNSWRGRGVG